MKLIHRGIDPAKDREYVLERHCRINYACDSPWAREVAFEAYRNAWMTSGQVGGFYSALCESMREPRSIAEIVQTDTGDAAAYLWAPFYEELDTGFSCLDVQDVYVEEAFRRRGIAEQLLAFCEDAARRSGAKVIRSGTGCVNTASFSLHEKMGFAAYRVEFEKVLK